MITETAAAESRLRPRILEIDETGRLDLNPPPATETGLPVPLPRSGGSRSSFIVAGAGLGILILTVLGIDLVQFIDRAFAHGPGLGVIAAAAVTAGCGGTGYWLVAELRALWRLRSAERLRNLIQSAVSSELKSEIATAAATLARDPQLREAVARFRTVIELHHSGQDALELFSRLVLARADRLAEASIRRAAAQAFAINALSPTALLDTLLFAARAIRLLREIAEIYGQRPGLAGTVHLLRRLAGGAGMVGAVDLVGGVLVQQLGGAVIERLSANAAESAYATQKMARLGIVAMALCRPVEFRTGEIPSLRSLVSGFLKADGNR